MMGKQIAGLITIGATFVKFIFTSMIPGLIKLAATFIATLAAMGPWGWAAIAGGIAAAAAGIVGLNKLMGGLGIGGGGGGGMGTQAGTPSGFTSDTQVFTPLTTGGFQATPKMHRGGIVPGSIGAPVPVMALGGEEFGGPGGVGGDTYNFSLPNYLGDRNQITEWIRESLLRIKSRNYTTGL